MLTISPVDAGLELGGAMYSPLELIEPTPPEFMDPEDHPPWEELPWPCDPWPPKATHLKFISYEDWPVTPPGQCRFFLVSKASSPVRELTPFFAEFNHPTLYPETRGIEPAQTMLAKDAAISNSPLVTPSNGSLKYSHPPGSPSCNPNLPSFDGSPGCSLCLLKAELCAQDAAQGSSSQPLTIESDAGAEDGVDVSSSRSSSPYSDACNGARDSNSRPPPPESDTDEGTGYSSSGPSTPSSDNDYEAREPKRQRSLPNTNGSSPSRSPEQAPTPNSYITQPTSPQSSGSSSKSTWKLHPAPRKRTTSGRLRTTASTAGKTGTPASTNTNPIAPPPPRPLRPIYIPSNVLSQRTPTISLNCNANWTLADSLTVVLAFITLVNGNNHALNAGKRAPHSVASMYDSAAAALRATGSSKSWSAVKSYWNRELRALSGVDERVRVPVGRAMRTSQQAGPSSGAHRAGVGAVASVVGVAGPGPGPAVYGLTMPPGAAVPLKRPAPVVEVDSDEESDAEDGEAQREAANASLLLEEAADDGEDDAEFARRLQAEMNGGRRFKRARHN